MHRLAEPVAVLALLVLTVFAIAGPVPSGNEFVYLIEPWRMAHPGVLAGDWTYSDWGQEHLVFNHLLSLPMRFLSLSAATWTARILCWAAIYAVLLRLGRRLGLNVFQGVAAIALWLMARQALVGGEWFIGGIEAKVLAYALLLWGYDRLLDDKVILGGLLVGASFTIHPSVGLAGGAAMLGGMWALGTPWPRIARSVGAAALTALPAVVIVFPLLTGAGGGNAEDWRLLVVDRLPWHLNSASFPQRDVLATALLTLVVFAVAFRRRDAVMRFLGGVTAVLALIFVAGMLARSLNQWMLLKYFPFRLLPPIVLLLFFFLLFTLWNERRQPWVGAGIGGLVLVTLMAIPSTQRSFLSLLEIQREGTDLVPHDEAATLGWFKANTPPTAVALMPPTSRGAFILSERPQVVSWLALPYNRIPEWRERMECVVGPLTAPKGTILNFARVEAAYTGRSAASMEGCARRFGAEYLITEGSYPWAELHRSGDWKVYRIPASTAGPP